MTRCLAALMLSAAVGCGPTDAEIASATADYCHAEEGRVKARAATVNALMELEAARAEGDPDKVRDQVRFHEFAKKSEEQSEALFDLVAARVRKLGIRESEIRCGE